MYLFPVVTCVPEAFLQVMVLPAGAVALRYAGPAPHSATLDTLTAGGVSTVTVIGTREVWQKLTVLNVEI
jgi:hypothetical protein